MTVKEFMEIHNEELQPYCNNPTRFFNLKIHNWDKPYSDIIIPMKHLYNREVKEVRKSNAIIDDKEVTLYSLYLEE